MYTAIISIVACILAICSTIACIIAICKLHTIEANFNDNVMNIIVANVDNVDTDNVREDVLHMLEQDVENVIEEKVNDSDFVSRIDTIWDRVYSVENTLEDMESRVESIEEDSSSIENRVSDLEDADINDMAETVSELDCAVDEIRREIEGDREDLTDYFMDITNSINAIKEKIGDKEELAFMPFHTAL